MKRLFDLIVVVITLFFLIIPLTALTILIRIKLGRPVFFRQIRPGLHGRPFQLIKFRTMTDARGSEDQILPDVDRITPFGRFLRSSSLDELPELINVLKGEMSLVGPRPLLTEYLSLYTQEQARRHEVKPGITGWAQVNGRNTLSWEKKFLLDVWYVDNYSLWLDIKILLLTVKKVLTREDISPRNLEIMPKFKSNGEDP